MVLLVTALLGAGVHDRASAQAWSYKEAAKPFAGKSITILDEITPLQETMKTLVPAFEKETGIKVDYQLLNHFEVISKGQADMLSGRGAYDAVLLHSPQMGLLLEAGVIRPIDDFLANKALANPGLDRADFIQPAADSLTKFRGKTYGFLNWNYNVVYWARGDLVRPPRREGGLQEEVRLRARARQDAPADAGHRGVLHPEEGREAGRPAPRE